MIQLVDEKLIVAVKVTWVTTNKQHQVIVFNLELLKNSGNVSGWRRQSNFLDVIPSVRVPKNMEKGETRVAKTTRMVAGSG